MNRYTEQKEKARAKAVDFQHEAGARCLSWGELAESAEKFEKLGKRWGLLREFRANGII